MFRLAKILSPFYFIVDVGLLIVTYGSAVRLLQRSLPDEKHALFLTGLTLLWLLSANMRKIYHTNLHNGVRFRISSYAEAYVLYSLTLIAILYLGKFPYLDGGLLLMSILLFMSMDVVVNIALVSFVSYHRRKKTKQVLVAGAGALAARITNYIKFNRDFGVNIIGYLHCKKEQPRISSNKIVGSVNDIKHYLNDHPVDEIVIALPYRSANKNIQKIISHADFHGVRVRYVPDYQGMFGQSAKTSIEGDIETINVRQLPLDEFYASAPKLIFDILFSGIALLLLSPVFAIIAVAIKLDSPGPVFYCPQRSGQGGKSFKLFKFRTMYGADASANGTLSTKKNDPRITEIGRFLRKYNLDELPQFLNVFLGDMSVVGPRPHRNFLNRQMQEHVDKYMVRYYFKPGITGWAQVNGWRGPTETEEQIARRTACDLWYIEHWSFLLDIKIIWLTIFGRKTYQNAF